MIKNKNIRFVVALGASLLALAVILGAFGAHALKESLTESQLAVYKTGNHYHFIHALGILLLAGLSGTINLLWLKRISLLLFTGILFFSGSLYLIATKDILGVSANWLGPITPLGGLFFILGWVTLLIIALKK